MLHLSTNSFIPNQLDSCFSNVFVWTHTSGLEIILACIYNESCNGQRDKLLIINIVKQKSFYDLKNFF